VRIVIALALAASLAACGKTEIREVDLDLIRIVGDARMRTDTVGEPKFATVASFVLVDAENASETGAYVTLAGAFTDAAGLELGPLKPQSLWVPAKGVRTFALIDDARVPRPTATSAKIEVRGARIASPPRAQIVDLRVLDDRDKVVVQATLVNESNRFGSVAVLAAFHDRDGRPMTRPHYVINIGPKRRHNVQFVGPRGSVRGTIYVGDEMY